jgi:hypothetical protein
MRTPHLGFVCLRVSQTSVLDRPVNEPQDPRGREPGVDERRQEQKEHSCQSNQVTPCHDRANRVRSGPDERQGSREMDQRLAKLVRRVLRKPVDHPGRQERRTRRQKQ